MATATAIIGAVGVASQIGTSIYGASQAKKAKRASDRLKKKMGDPTNPYAHLTESTIGSEFQSEQAARNLATQTQALSQAGARGMSFIPSVARNTALINNQIASQLDMQRKQIEQQIAQGELYKQQVNENRYLTEQQGYAQQYAAGQQNVMSGIQGATNILASGLAPQGFLSGVMGGMGSKPAASTAYSQPTRPVAGFGYQPLIIG